MCAAASGRVFLFSGHMIDAPGRVDPRFPPQLESAIAKAIHDKLDQLQCAPPDIAISSGACGADILFAEEVLARGLKLRMHLPVDEKIFIEKSVAIAGGDWLNRFRVVASRAEQFVAAELLGPLGDNEDPFERTNRWMLDEALRIGGAGACLICVWDGQGGDGPGGTKHMVETVLKRGGQFHWVDIRRL